jgi:hypothetical protein
MLLETFGLAEIAITEAGVQILITLDGAGLFDNASHVMGGAKITDKRARDPSHGLGPISDNEMAHSLLGKIQTRDACACLKILFAQDSKNTYNEDFPDMFVFAEQLRTVGIPESRHGPALKPFDVSFPQDMASFWKSLGLGGAAKVKEFFVTFALVVLLRFFVLLKGLIGARSVMIVIVKFAVTLQLAILHYWPSSLMSWRIALLST